MTTLEFPTWYAQVDAKCQAICGLGIEDLADGPSYDCWQNGLTPTEYVRERLEEEGFPM